MLLIIALALLVAVVGTREAVVLVARHGSAADVVGFSGIALAAVAALAMVLVAL